ncbi:MAG: succinate dehydrogenase, hydrophobic membrane anchor protein [Anaerolineales bacterium]
MATNTRRVEVPQNYDTVAWKWMRYSAILLIPLVWIHIILQDVIVGVHDIDANYVAMRWGLLFWQIYDILLLGFAFAHGVNGLRQVLRDYITSDRWMRIVSIGLLIFWGVLTFIGAVGIILATRSVLFS